MRKEITGTEFLKNREQNKKAMIPFNEVVKLIDQYANLKNRCKICNKETYQGFSINLKFKCICETCAKAVFIQQAQWYTKQTD